MGVTGKAGASAMPSSARGAGVNSSCFLSWRIGLKRRRREDASSCDIFTKRIYTVACGNFLQEVRFEENRRPHLTKDQALGVVALAFFQGIGAAPAASLLLPQPWASAEAGAINASG